MRTVPELQEEALEICKIICKVCEKHNLPYYLAAGSLLGAVRHKGFIPWDDDMDLELMRSDYKKLIKILEYECSDVLLIQNYKHDKTFPFPFSKIFLKKDGLENLGYPALNRCGSAFVDIFPLSRCPSNKKIAKFYFKFIQLVTLAIRSNRVSEEEFTCGYTKKGALILYKFFKRMPMQFGPWTCWVTGGFFHIFSGRKYVCYAGGKYGYPDEVYLSEWYKKSDYKEFEKTSIPVPYDWDSLLKHKYGDYMQLPDENERQGHFE